MAAAAVEGSGIPAKPIYPIIEDAIARAREACGGVRGDCDYGGMILEDILPGAKRYPIGGPGMDHFAVDYKGLVLDPTAAQYVKPAAWSPAALQEAGLSEAVRSGVFTPEQHAIFCKGINDAARAAETRK